MGIAKINFKRIAALAVAFVFFFSAQAMAINTWDGSIDCDLTAVNNVITITTGAQLAGLAKNVNDGEDYAGTTIRLANDINLDSRSWTPIGRFFSYLSNSNRAFRGIFDGAGYTISGLKVENNEYNYEDRGETAALFGYIDFPSASSSAYSVQAAYASAAAAEDLAKAEAASFALSGEKYQRFVAERKDFYETFGIAPSEPQTLSITSAPTGGIVKNLKVSGNVTNTYGQGAAGIVCWNDGLIENCYFDGTVTRVGDELEGDSGRAYVGGICSLLGPSTYVVNCAAKVTAKAYGDSFSYAGGIAGYCYSMNLGYIVNCAVESGSVIDSYMDSGGIVGGFAYRVYNCVSAASQVLLSGEIENDAGTYVGGIVGAFGAGTNCYWLKTSDNNAQPRYAVGGTVIGGGDVEDGGELEDGSEITGRCSTTAQLPVGAVHFGQTVISSGSSASVTIVEYPTVAEGTQPTLSSWSVADSDVATVNNGTISAKNEGSTTVTATAASSAWETLSDVTVTPEGLVRVTD